MWKKLPQQQLLLRTNSQDSSDLFNEMLKEFAAALREEFNRIIKIKEASSEQEKTYLWTIWDDMTQSLEAVQLTCCKSIKILRWVLTRSGLYLRRGPRAAEHTEDDMEVENEASNVD